MDSARIVQKGPVRWRPENEAPMTCVIEKPGIVRAVNGKHYFSPARIMQTAIALEMDAEQIARLIGKLVFDTQETDQ